jgi:uncharacterized protein YeaO (DUF488 family)
MPTIQIKRIYDSAAASDGFRVLVDRLWPRGVRKTDADIDLWAKDITPSPALREDLHSGLDPWPLFRKEYRAELRHNPALAAFVETIRDKQTVTLLTATKDLRHTHAAVLAEVLREQSKRAA